MALTQQQVHSAMGQDNLLHGKALLVLPTTDSHHITLSHKSMLWPHAFHGMFVLIAHFCEFLIASIWEGDIQLHLDTAGSPGGAMKKGQ